MDEYNKKMEYALNSAKGEREDIAHAVNAEFKADLESAIMDEYNKKMEYAKSQKQQRRGR
jgi:DNA-binding cell septation regulator SpoVG